MKGWLVATLIACSGLGVWCSAEQRQAAARPSIERRAPRAASFSWPQWRGPGRDGKIDPHMLPGRWPERLVRRWQVTVGEGHASPIVAGGGVFVFSREGEEEVLRRLDPATGRALWRRAYAAPYEMDPAARGHGKGPKSTPTYHNGRVFTLGISGILSCLDAVDGRVRWRHEFPRGSRPTSPLYGAAMSPLAVDDLLMAHVGGHDDGALTAFDAGTGTVRWRWTGDGPAYASPILLERDGVRQVVTQTQRQCVGVDVASGKLLWAWPFGTPYDQNCVTPVAIGELILFGGTRQPTFALRIRHRGGAWTAEKVWETREVTLYMSTPVADGSRLYGMSERRQGQLFTLDAATGKTLWTGDARLGENAALLDGGRVILVLSTGGELSVLRKSGGPLIRIARYNVAESPTWASPAVWGNRILVKDATTLSMWEAPA
jgi:outer membrane protein assembly factor BamB